MLVLTTVWILSSLTPGICSHCWSALNDPSGQNNFDIKLDPGKLFNGIVTIEGVLNTDHAPESGVPDKDFLKFLAEGDPTDAPILEIETQVHKSQQCMFISGTVRDESLSWTVSYPSVPKREPICDHDGLMKISQENLVKLQISSINIESLKGYEVYLGGFDKLLIHHLFKYGSPENWQKFENRRVDRTRRIVNVCNQGCRVSYTKISVCSDPQPKLLDKMAIDVIIAELGKTYTLSCSASGEPYLGSEWRDKEGSSIPGHHEVATVEGTDFHIESRLVISDFDIKDAGNYTCKFFNKNFESSIEKVVALHYLSLISTPNDTYNFNEGETCHLHWVVQGWPLQEVQLRCQTESRQLITPHLQPLDGSPPKLRLTVEITDVAPAFLSCVLIKGTEFVDHIIVSRKDQSSSKEIVLVADQETSLSYDNLLIMPILVFISVLALVKYVLPNLILTRALEQNRCANFLPNCAYFSSGRRHSSDEEAVKPCLSPESTPVDVQNIGSFRLRSTFYGFNT